MDKCRYEAAECQQQQQERGGNDETFAALHIVGTGFTNVEIERRFARQFKLQVGILAAQLILKTCIKRVQRRNQRLD
jgi:hypothetical protein